MNSNRPVYQWPRSDYRGTWLTQGPAECGRGEVVSRSDLEDISRFLWQGAIEPGRSSIRAEAKTMIAPAFRADPEWSG